MRVLTIAAAMLISALPTLAEAQSAAAGCGTASAVPVAAPTPPPAGQDPAAGTAPGGAGSSGFTGGTGGSFIGTTQSGPDKASPSAQPVTAKGLDPIAGLPNAPKC